jgi:hypothetical protein
MNWEVGFTFTMGHVDGWMDEWIQVPYSITFYVQDLPRTDIASSVVLNVSSVSPGPVGDPNTQSLRPPETARCYPRTMTMSRGFRGKYGVVHFAALHTSTAWLRISSAVIIERQDPESIPPIEDTKVPPVKHTIRKLEVGYTFHLCVFVAHARAG